MAILNQFELKKPIRATLSNSNIWFKFDHPQSGLYTKTLPKNKYAKLTIPIISYYFAFGYRILLRVVKSAEKYFSSFNPNFSLVFGNLNFTMQILSAF